MKWFSVVWMVVLLCCTSAISYAIEDRLSMYPLAEQGSQRMVIHLPELVNEQDHVVELQVGTLMETDCNRYLFAGKMVSKTVEGWGYPYLVVTDIVGPMSTRMACPPYEEMKTTFVHVQLDAGKQRYNSKLPVVVYVPDGFELRYRIWTVTGPSRAANVE